jgi:hypothetical protein
MYGCETWSIILKERHGLRVFENRVLREIFGSKTDEVTLEWRKLHNEERYDLYCSPSVVCKFMTLPQRFLLRMGDVSDESIRANQNTFSSQ